MAGSPDQHVDTILHKLGSKARFTVFQIITCTLGLFPGYFQVLVNVFLGVPVFHQCAPPSNGSILTTEDANINITYDQCNIRYILNGTVMEETECDHGMAYGAEVDKSFISQFGLVCNEASLAQLSQTLLIAGQGIGAFSATIVSDRWGRKPVIVGSNFGLLAAGTAAAFATDYTMFAVMKLLIGAFQQGVVTSFYTFTIELFVTKDRRISPVVGTLMVPVSYMVMDLMAFSLQGYSWRVLQLVVSLCSLATLFQWWYQDESLRWLVANGKHRRATAYIKRASICNGLKSADILDTLQLEKPGQNDSTNEKKEIPQKKDPTLDKKPESDDDSVTLSLGKATKPLSILDIFKAWRLAKTTIIIWLSWITIALGYFVIYLSSVQLSGNIYLNFFLISLMELPANGFFFYGFNRYGRRWSLFMCLFLLSIGLLANSLLESLQKSSLTASLGLVSFCVGMIGASGGFGVLFGFTPELYPTNVRNQALGLASLVSRIGGMLAPFMGVLKQEAAWGPGLLIGCVGVFVIILLPLLPETRGRELPQTFKDLTLWFEKGNGSEQEDEHFLPREDSGHALKMTEIDLKS